MIRTIDVGGLLDHSPWTVQQKRWTILAALAIIFDGFDIQILGFAIPSLIREWHVARSAFGPVLALGSGTPGRPEIRDGKATVSEVQARD